MARDETTMTRDETRRDETGRGATGRGMAAGRRRTLAIGCGLALGVAAMAVAGTAGAADLPSRVAPPVFAPPLQQPAFSFTGGYVGGQVGYQFGRSQALGSSALTGQGLVAAGDEAYGVLGGAHLGYLYSTQGLPLLSGLASGVSTLPFVPGFAGVGGVIGIEGDVDGSAYREHGYPLGGILVSGSEPIQGSVRGRVGAAFDRVLLYGTGGVAFVDQRNAFANEVVGGLDRFDRTRVGYTVGGGVEYAVTDRVSLRAEYRFTDFGAFNSNLSTTGGGLNVRLRETDDRVQGGFSVKLDGGGPLAAFGAIPQLVGIR